MSVVAKTVIRSREKKWALYTRTFPPRKGERILDVGASALTEIPWENWFLKRYPYPEQVTAVVLEDGDKVSRAFPGVNVIEADGRDLPFVADEFDIVHSNAVIEHVGDTPDQQRFAAELARVAKHGFVTTPNRWFPIEAHCQLPFVHWLPRPYSWKTQHLFGKTESDWWLLGPSRFSRMVPGKLHRIRMAGLTATLVVTF